MNTTHTTVVHTNVNAAEYTFYSLNFRKYVLSVVRVLVLVLTRYLVSFHHDRTSRFPGP